KEQKFTQSLVKLFSSSNNLRLVFAILRSFKPILKLKKQIILCYDNKGTVIVTRYQDFMEVMRRDDVFDVVYEPRMEKITAGKNFFLGMQNTPTYTRDVSNMRLAFKREDIPTIILPIVDSTAHKIIQEKQGDIDVVQDLTLVIPTLIVQKYFGIPADDKSLMEWSKNMFQYLFLDLAADKQLEDKTLKLAGECRNFIDEHISACKANDTIADNVLGRCLAMQKINLEGMDDETIRNNLIGLLIGAIPTTSMAATQALYQILIRPDLLHKIQEAIHAQNNELFSSYIFEALRFQPANPFIYRRANSDVIIAKNTFRQHKIKKDTMVLASNLSAMFDYYAVSSPNKFCPTRPKKDYILWGNGLHECFGAYFNSAVIPAILKPLLKQNNLRFADNNKMIDYNQTPFPVHMNINFKPS
ncbi:MAG: cytochrome P450, partial [Alphaproteobacteria bacterium]|nr:cytochrome P450 [Alphaproteobacteria bacterium]